MCFSPLPEYNVPHFRKQASKPWWNFFLVVSQLTYRGDSGNICRVLPFQVLLQPQSTSAQLASSQSCCFSSTACSCHRRLITESLNDSMVGVGRDLCGSPSPTPCWSRVTQSRLHRTLSRRVWNISREGDSTTSLGRLFQSSVTLRGKKFFLMFRRNFLCFSLCPLPLVLSLGTKYIYTSPSIIVHHPCTSGDGPWCARTQQTLTGLCWPMGVPRCVSPIQVPAPLCSACGPSSISAIAGQSGALLQLVVGELFCPLRGRECKVNCWEEAWGAAEISVVLTPRSKERGCQPQPQQIPGYDHQA